MKILFTQTDTPYLRGRVYDLPQKEAEKFKRHGVAVEATVKERGAAKKKTAAKRKSTKKKVTM